MDRPNGHGFPGIPDNPLQLQEFLEDTSKENLRVSDQPGWNGKKTPIPEQAGPGAEHSIQGRIGGSPFDNIPAGYSLGPLNSILNVIIQSSQDEIIPWSWWPMLRDRQLRKLWKSENIMAGGLYAMSGRLKALPWEVSTPKTRIQARFQSLIANADFGRGWGEFAVKTCLDLLTQDNGAFWELLGAGKPDGPLVGPVLGVAHLDSNMMWRTHDATIPAIYINPYTGQYHGLHASRIVSMSSMTQPDELARGVGFSAVSRCERWLKIAFGEANYRDEKISGRFKRAIIYGSGATRTQFDNAIAAVEEQNDAAGLTSFSGIPVLLTMQPDMKLNMLELAKLPDGFDLEKEIVLYVNVLALAFGTDAREFWPASVSGATKADANTQHMKAQGKGIADIMQTIERALNWHVLPEGVTFAFDFADEERELLNAQIRQVEAQTLNVLALSGGINGAEVRSMAIHQEIIDLDAMAKPDVKIVAGDDAPVPQDAITDPEDAAPAETLAIKIKADTVSTEIIEQYTKDLQALLDEYALHRSAHSDPDWLRNKFHDLLVLYMRKSYSAGLNGTIPSDKGLEKLLDIAKTSFGYFNDSFLPDLIDAEDESDRFGDPEARESAVQSRSSRMGMYAGAAWLATWAGVDDQISQRDTPPRVMRLMDVAAEHCDTCPGKEGIYDDIDAMEAQAGIPGDGSDDCMSNCRCRLLVESEPGSGNFVNIVGGADISMVPMFSLL